MHRTASRRASLLAGVTGLGLAASGLAAPGLAAAGAGNPTDRAYCAALAVTGGPASSQRQADFTAAAKQYGVPRGVLLAVSYLESRWDDHGGAPSTSGGYGPMHLTDVKLPDQSFAKGDGSKLTLGEPASLHTLGLAVRLTGLPARQLRVDPAANICGGAALLARYQRQVGGPTGASTRPGAWYGAIARYSGAADEGTASRFAADVFSVLRSGERRTTVDGQQVRLAAHPAVAPQRSQLQTLRLNPAANRAMVQCPRLLRCDWIPAPYEKYGEEYWEYGNHDLANRPRDMKIDYIVIHDTEASWRTTLALVQDPTYVSWHYSLRSSDGLIAQHVRHNDVAWHAGNWYVNMHSIGLEHEGVAEDGALWYTEAMYRTSARLVRYLANLYDIPLDRGHIIGHDQIPGPAPEYVAGMHWDPGPYWDWEHYFDLLGAPIDAPAANPGNRVRTVAPGFEHNRPVVTGCRDDEPTKPCARQGTNFTYLRTGPSFQAPLVKDVGLHSDGSRSTKQVWDISARAAAGHKFHVVKRVGSWTQVWYLGDQAWFYDPAGDRTSVRSTGTLVKPAPGRDEVPVYGRAYPERAAYAPYEIPYQEVTPLQYTMKAGQSYVLADANIETDYYYAWSYDDSLPDDHTEVQGTDRYYLIWFGHRMAYVRAADVVLKPAL